MIIKRNIMLIGSMGSGKSHFGRNLAERKGWQFVDTDRVLEGRFGLPIAEIFKKIGEKAFRRAEMDVLKKVCLYHEAVISVGGNFPIEHRTLKVLKILIYYWYSRCTISYCEPCKSPNWETSNYGLQ